MNNKEEMVQGPKTHEQQLRILERKPDISDSRHGQGADARARIVHSSEARSSEFPVSQRGMNQESDHNKHNDRGQKGHKPQTPTLSQEKQK
jgi:hypothetical protein